MSMAPPHPRHHSGTVMPLLAPGLALLLALAAVSCRSAGSRQDNATHSVEQSAQDPGRAAPERSLPWSADQVDIARARAENRQQLFEWHAWSDATFARARVEGRHILLHGAAVWCHWCHVMEETTYRDPAVGRLLRERFIAIRVDIDSRPDVAERYEDWGWPATVLLTPGAEELGKYKGYMTADKLVGILSAALERDGSGAESPLSTSTSTSASTSKPPDGEPDPASSRPANAARPDMLGWIAEAVTRDMDAYYDDEGGSWGVRQKLPIGANAEFEVRRAARGVAGAAERSAHTLAQHARLIDPVWGGIYQYSTHGDWEHPHYEKLMTSQAANLEAFARGYQHHRDPALRSHAERIAAYVARFMTSEQGTFYVTQDADVGTHDRARPFVHGDDYFPLDEAGRLARGIPWVDDHVYAYQNGLMIAALCTLHDVAPTAARGAPYLARARRAADALLASHVAPDGAVLHDADSASPVRHLADAAGLGRALARLAEITGEPRYRDAAVRIARTMDRTLRAGERGALWAHTPDPHAAGVFTRRRQPFAHNVLAARFLAALARITGDSAWRDRAAEILAAVSTPKTLDEQGRLVGHYLLAVDEVGAYSWPADAPAAPRP